MELSLVEQLQIATGKKARLIELGVIELTSVDNDILKIKNKMLKRELSKKSDTRELYKYIDELKLANANLKNMVERQKETIRSFKVENNQLDDEKFELEVGRKIPRQTEEELLKTLDEVEVKLADLDFRQKEGLLTNEEFKNLKKTIASLNTKKTKTVRSLQVLNEYNKRKRVESCVMCQNVAAFASNVYYCSKNCMSEHCSK